MIETVLETVASILIVVGAFFLLVGSFGLAKLPDTMRRLHAPTKATTLGIGSLLIASMVYFAGTAGVLSFHELLITLFLFLTAPVSAHMIAKVHILRNKEKRKTLPETGSAAEWATLSGADVRKTVEAKP
ncbi:Na+/H+ antiporter subunit G (plasmid) [Rhizobium oryzihabitans]|uniref:Na+/H+ antiporter subunit G n=1 Tax=Rhizobium oryzihabitans TaxID=2267833 RepID=A0A7L5BR34_9HYPH|nr:Na+/H+ antiporter subunit G [Rhizobium oryzihabitans]QCM08812.1 Na+/H+ antiporter subunit G [Agrobacterium tumefaciens]QIB41397.1 Na+/H+ antiporter subunit G [Rhizobium oryzihabitans]CUX67620.1 putative monovalent cation/H+ antiporter subunit G [Agrobacterium genomosp. 5 str. CFBP 6626]